MRNPYVQSWNFSVERAVPGGFVLRTSYAGSKGTHLVDGIELNPAVYAPGVTSATGNQRRIYAPALGSTALIEPIGNSTFHSLQLTAERRLRHGLSVLADYQFSKSLHDSGANKGNAITLTNPASQHTTRAGRSSTSATSSISPISGRFPRISRIVR